MNDWISIEDQELPPVGEVVLVCDEYNSFVSLGRATEDGEFELMWVSEIEVDSNVTHWMPLPKLPEAQMNRKKRKLLYIRYKNRMAKKGYKLPKWTLVGRGLPYKWINNSPGLLEDSWVIDFGFA